MKRLKKIISSLILVTLILQPAAQPRGNTLKWVAIGLSIFTVGTVAASTVTYHAAKNRSIKTPPAPINFTTIGNERGQPVIYSHGLGRCGKDAEKYGSVLDPKKYHIAAFDYEDVGDINKKKEYSRFNYDHVNLAQEKDIKRLGKAVDRFNKPNTLAFGISRGAATLINYMGIEGSKNISAMVLEAPFATTQSTIKHVSKKRAYIGKIPFVASLSPTITQAIFPHYKNDGPQPINSIKKIRLDVPILILHSMDDRTCPFQDSRDLYIKRKQQGVNNVYFVEFKSCRHGKLLFEKEKEKAQAVIHAFYKKYNFPYNPKLADKVNLNDYQPNVEQLLGRKKCKKETVCIQRA